MKKISFTLQDSPDCNMGIDVDFHPVRKDEYTVREEQALAILIYNRFPQLKECHRRIKKLTVTDENGETYETNDFDIYGSLTKKTNKNEIF